MDEDIASMELSTEDKCVHEDWSERVHGYEEWIKTFGCMDDDNSSEWNKFSCLLKKLVVDSSAAEQTKGLGAVMTYIEKAACAEETVGEVMNGIVNECLAAPIPEMRDLALKITLTYIEIEKHEIVQEELLKGTEAKNPKIVTACISALTLALQEFGSEVINTKRLLEKIPVFLEDSHECVQEAAKAMGIELYKWLYAPLKQFKQQLNTSIPDQMAQFEAKFLKLDDSEIHPTRHLRSQKSKSIWTTELTSDGDGNDINNEKNDNEESVSTDIDAYELIDSVDILSKLPEKFYKKIEAKTWQERKETLEALEDLLLKNPELESGDYSVIVRALTKVIREDSNVVIVAIAGECLAGLATGLKKRFQPYVSECLLHVLEKFHETKPTVMIALQEAADALFISGTLDVILEGAIAALSNRNPSVRAETTAFLARSFANTPAQNLNDTQLEVVTGALLKTLNDPDRAVRYNSTEALGAAMKLVGENAIMPFFKNLNSLKIAKIQEYAEQALILTKPPSPRKVEHCKTVPTKTPPQELSALSTVAEIKSGLSTIAMKKPTAKKLSEAADSTPTKDSTAPELQIERDLSTESADEMAGEYFPSSILTGLVDTKWKCRLAAVGQLSDVIKEMDPAQVPVQIIVRLLSKNPGFKDANSQVLKSRLEVVIMLADNYPFSMNTSSYCINEVIEALGDTKNTSTAADTLTAIAEAISLKYVATEVITCAFTQDNPKVQQEALLWLSNALLEFGCTIDVDESLIEDVKYALTVANPGVRTSALTLLSTMYLFLGKPLFMFFEDEEAVLQQQIQQECEKHKGITPPEPKRGLKAKSRTEKTEDAEDDGETNKETSDNHQPHIDDISPKVEIMIPITEPLHAELRDENGNVQKEDQQNDPLEHDIVKKVIACLEKRWPRLSVEVLPVQEKQFEEPQQEAVKSDGAIKVTEAITPNNVTVSKPHSSGEDDNNVDTNPLFVVNNLKHQHVIVIKKNDNPTDAVVNNELKTDNNQIISAEFDDQLKLTKLQWRGSRPPQFEDDSSPEKKRKINQDVLDKESYKQTEAAKGEKCNKTTKDRVAKKRKQEEHNENRNDNGSVSCEPSKKKKSGNVSSELSKADELKLRSINVKLIHNVPPQHNIKKYDHLFAMIKIKGKKFVKNVEVKEEEFSPEEDEMIIRNWQNFCKNHNWDEKRFYPFVSIKSLKSYNFGDENCKKFVQFLANGLPNKTLYKVYSRFVNLDRTFTCKNKRYTQKEDDIIWKTIVSNEESEKTELSDKLAVLAKILNRTYKSVRYRYNILTEHKSVRYRYNILTEKRQQKVDAD